MIFKKSLFRKIAVCLIILLTVFSCKTTDNTVSSSPESLPENTESSSPSEFRNHLPSESISLLFAGDIMAHSQNFRMGNFDKIWKDITELLHSSDLNFANIEAPVCNDIPWSNYPQFNMHSDYIESAVKAGFNVFSLSNNHTNDQYLQGIKSTYRFFNSKKDIWACGIKKSSGAPLTYALIEKKGWKILFVAVTEILNRNDYSSWIDYYPSSKRQQLKSDLLNLKKTTGADLFILSIHTNEPEYVKEITSERKEFYAQISQECGTDIIWANHPHVPRIFETISRKPDSVSNSDSTFIMYGNGNTISGQRTSPSLTKAENSRDDTGDSFIIKVKISGKDGKIHISDITPSLTSIFIAPSWQFVIKLLDDDLFHSLERSELSDWSSYMKKRKAKMENLINIKQTEKK